MREKLENSKVKPPEHRYQICPEPKGSGGGSAMHKAFRQADLHTNICRVASGYYDIGSKNTFDWQML